MSEIKNAPNAQQLGAAKVAYEALKKYTLAISECRKLGLDVRVSAEDAWPSLGISVPEINIPPYDILAEMFDGDEDPRR